MQGLRGNCDTLAALRGNFSKWNWQINPAGAPVTSITPFTRLEAFDPETIRLMSLALDSAWTSLGAAKSFHALPHHADKSRETLARCIIEMAKLGERNSFRLSEGALFHLRERSKIA